MLAEDEEDMTVTTASSMQHVGGSNFLEQLPFKLWAILLDAVGQKWDSTTKGSELMRSLNFYFSVIEAASRAYQLIVLTI